MATTSDPSQLGFFDFDKWKWCDIYQMNPDTYVEPIYWSMGPLISIVPLVIMMHYNGLQKRFLQMFLKGAEWLKENYLLKDYTVFDPAKHTFMSMLRDQFQKTPWTVGLVLFGIVLDTVIKYILWFYRPVGDREGIRWRSPFSCYTNDKPWGLIYRENQGSMLGAHSHEHSLVTYFARNVFGMWMTIVMVPWMHRELLIWCDKLGRKVSSLSQCSLIIMTLGYNGNLLDRVFVSYVIDFIGFNGAVWNIADFYIIGGTIVLFFDLGSVFLAVEKLTRDLEEKEAKKESRKTRKRSPKPRN